MKKILIITSSFDLTADYMINSYSLNCDFFRFNIDNYDQYLISISNTTTSIKNQLRRECIIDSDTSIWFRKPVLPKYDMKNGDLEYCHKEIFSQIEGILESHDGITLEKPSILRRASNKVFQLALAQKIGFSLPQSHISNNRETIIESVKLNGQHIIKPISIGKIFNEDSQTTLQTELLSNDDQLNELNFCPSYFQEYIPKDFEIRLTVIGNAFFGVKIESNNPVDWRKDRHNHLSVIEVPNYIKDLCMEIMIAMGIKFGAFDFIVSNGEYYFLEVNPNGQWLWLEQKLNLKISNSLYSLLTTNGTDHDH